MKSSTEEIRPLIGTTMAGGYYAGRIMIDGQAYALIVAPKADGEREDVEWIDDVKSVPDAKSYHDGMANTRAMAVAGSQLAQWAMDLRIADADDWYLPSQDELEIMYRNLKPGTRQNYCFARSGINLSALTPTRPYTPEHPVQTCAEAFQVGAPEALEQTWYWSSTQHAAESVHAWAQYFGDGGQFSDFPYVQFRARAVRRLVL